VTVADASKTTKKIGAAIVPVTPFRQNCTLLWCARTLRAAVIDPGGDLDRVRAAITETKVKVEKIWLTHGHIDHAGGAAELKDDLGVTIEGPHRTDKFLLDRLPASGLKFGMHEVRVATPDRWLDDGDRVEIGDLAFDVLHCPGHSPGSIVFVDQDDRFAIVGDVLFRGSVGRTDIPGGDHAALLASIRNKLLPLGDDVAFICGHGPASTIGRERTSNPFLR
jgi:glyoxylase-like metal-dependent hydrolase (beta-lactamase superfamily II)